MKHYKLQLISMKIRLSRHHNNTGDVIYTAGIMRLDFIGSEMSYVPSIIILFLHSKM